MNKITLWTHLAGIYPSKLRKSLKGYPYFRRDLKLIKQQLSHQNDFKITRLHPCLEDRFEESGVLSGHYFHQDLYVAQKIFQNKPAKHLDIGSRTDGFVAHVASFREIDVVDIRDLKNTIPQINFIKADFSIENPGFDNYCDSISCLHAIEHFGLGRYGDTVDVNGHIKGLNNIYRTLKQGGKFYFLTPIGPLRIEFNAHRVFSIEYLLRLFDDKYKIDSFSYVDDKGDLYRDTELSKQNIENNFSCRYGCGIFEMTKI
jgi:SAM-dependent methyltransferase